MKGWDTSTLNLVNNGRFEVADPGPLHAPIHRLSIRRNANFKLVLETHGPGIEPTAVDRIPAGTIRLNTEKVELVDDLAGTTATLSGVIKHNYTLSHGPHSTEHQESSTVDQLTVTCGDVSTARYVIEWLELPRHLSLA